VFLVGILHACLLSLTQFSLAVINAGVLTSAFSAGNSLLYGTSRQIYGLALRGQAPRIFAKTTKVGSLYLYLLLVLTSIPIGGTSDYCLMLLLHLDSSVVHGIIRGGFYRLKLVEQPGRNPWILHMG
jgi:amino acid transporter